MSTEAVMSRQNARVKKDRKSVVSVFAAGDEALTTHEIKHQWQLVAQPNSRVTVVDPPDKRGWVKIRSGNGRVGFAHMSRLRKAQPTGSIYPEIAAEGELCAAHVTFVGGSGIPLRVEGEYDLFFTREQLHVVSDQRDWRHAIRLGDIHAVHISGQGSVTSGGGFMGGGFGLEGAAQGVAVATVLNLLTTQTEMDTRIQVTGDEFDLFFHHAYETPRELRVQWSPVFVLLEQRRSAAPTRTDSLVKELEDLARLRDTGVLTEEEFLKAKERLLRG